MALPQCSSQCYTATAIPFIYSFSGNSAASASISTFMCLWAIYIFTGSVYIFPPAKQAGPSWEYIIRYLTHACGNWDWGPDIPFLGIFVSNFRHFVFAVYLYIVSVAMLGLNHAANHYSTLKKTNAICPSKKITVYNHLRMCVSWWKLERDGGNVGMW